MKKIKIHCPAKVNFALDVGEVKNGYHEINSVVSTISLADEIILKKRKDNKITLKIKGFDVGCATHENNAYKSAELFINTYKTLGVDIILNKKIPVGGGLGGSSSDISGVLLGMKKLFGGNLDVKPLADRLGSDSTYLLEGGLAFISGRGEKVLKTHSDLKFYLIIVYSEQILSASKVYKEFDKQNLCFTAKAKSSRKAFISGDSSLVIKNLKNDLYIPAKTLLPEIESNVTTLSNFAPTIMSGSGSAVFSLFTDKKERDKVYKQLKKLYNDKIIKTETIF
jgi:4-diphosphocytidyl-2C-methyl-D-erythritol kinase